MYNGTLNITQWLKPGAQLNLISKLRGALLDNKSSYLGDVFFRNIQLSHSATSPNAAQQLRPVPLQQRKSRDENPLEIRRITLFIDRDQFLVDADNVELHREKFASEELKHIP